MAKRKEREEEHTEDEQRATARNKLDDDVQGSDDGAEGVAEAKASASTVGSPRNDDDNDDNDDDDDDDDDDARGQARSTSRTGDGNSDDNEAQPEREDEDDDEDDDEDNDEDDDEDEDEEEEGEVADTNDKPDAPPPLPNEPVPGDDDGWSAQWDPTHQAWYFHNRFTGQTQWDNPRVPTTSSASPSALQPPLPQSHLPPPLPQEKPAAAAVGGYNPAIHGDYDPNAWYAKGYEHDPAAGTASHESTTAIIDHESADPDTIHVGFNRWTGQFQHPDLGGPERHSDESKSRRQMNAYFDVDAAANAHDGRSLKAERAGKRLSKAELKQFKDKRKAKKEEKRRAWLRD